MSTLLQAAMEVHLRAAELRNEVGEIDRAEVAEMEQRVQRLSDLLLDAVRGAL